MKFFFVKDPDSEPTSRQKIPVKIFDQQSQQTPAASTTSSNNNNTAHSSTPPKMGNTMANNNNNTTTTPTNSNNNSNSQQSNLNSSHNNTGSTSNVQQQPSRKHPSPGTDYANSDFATPVPKQPSPPTTTTQQSEAAAAATSVSQVNKIAQQKCDDVLNELNRLEKDVEGFAGVKNDKVYIKLEELLTRCLLRLDEIDRGEETINQNRKKLINFTHKLSDKLEEIATGNSTSLVPVTAAEALVMAVVEGSSDSKRSNSPNSPSDAKRPKSPKDAANAKNNHNKQPSSSISSLINNFENKNTPTSNEPTS